MISARIPDINGWYEVTANPLSKAGVFPYTAKSIGAPGWEQDPGRIVMVYRPADELADPDTIASFRLIPWTDEHAMLGSAEVGDGLITPENKGVHGTLGEQIYFDPDDNTLYGNVKLWSSELADLIDAGKKELSCGFRCVYEFVTGTFEGLSYEAVQRCIRANHFASVWDGRMGPGVAVLDHMSFALGAKELKPMAALAKKSSPISARVAARLKASGSTVTLDAAVLAAMDAEDDGEGDAPKGGMTLEDIASTLSEVGPALAEINKAIASMAPTAAMPAADPATLDDDMEPMMDAGGVAMTNPDGSPKMQKKGTPPAVAAGADATPPALGIAAMDSALKTIKAVAVTLRSKLPAGVAVPATLTAMDAAIATSEANLVKLRTRRPTTSPALAAMDSRLAAAEKILAGTTVKTLLAEIAGRDALAGRLSNFVGTFDHSEMTTDEVAKYGVTKLGLKTPVGAELATLEGYMHDRTPAAKARLFALDSAMAPGDGANAKVANFIAGRSA